MKIIPDLEKYPKGEWIQIDPNTIAFRWNIPTKPIKTSLVWRGIPIHLRMESRSNQYGWTFVMTWLYNHKLYHVKTTKWKWSGGRHGDNPPEIATSTHRLKIRSISSGIMLQDDQVLPYDAPPGHQIFEIVKTPEDVDFGDPWSTGKIEPSRVVPAIIKDEVSLYDYDNTSIHLQSNAYYEEDCLVVDHWKLTDHSESEEYCTVAQNHLSHLFDYFRIQDKNKTELLVAIHNGFKGQDAFKTFIKFLDENHIPYSLLRG